MRGMMRLRRAVLAVLAAAGLAAQAPAAAEDAVAAGEQVFARDCASCHDQAEIAWWGEKHPEPDDRRAFFDAFLQRHFPPAPDDRARVIEYLEHVIAAEDAGDAD
jgi:hypothetical protein